MIKISTLFRKQISTKSWEKEGGEGRKYWNAKQFSADRIFRSASRTTRKFASLVQHPTANAGPTFSFCFDSFPQLSKQSYSTL